MRMLTISAGNMDVDTIVFQPRECTVPYKGLYLSVKFDSGELRPQLWVRVATDRGWPRSGYFRI